ncbi:hypothetical protein [Winogradskyella sp.]|uniref:hypothetical protein n=1 Tax=Winogradskyella sp. TaxID=1883156 RepID=UPI003AA9A338
MSVPAAFIVEGYCEYDTFPSFYSKILGQCYIPISNAKGIGNLTKNTGDELLKVIKLLNPEIVIITLDYREALREKLVENCVELKEMVMKNCEEFIKSQENGSLKLPKEIVVVIADKTYESWLCADYEGLKTNELINEELITEEFDNVDIEIPNPNKWLNSKLKENVDLKSKANRKKIATSLRPEIAKENSRSFEKFYKEVSKINVA